ncbi:alanine racemase [Vescimonas sp.]|uniref:alanine racemase n=1 Tax=Vescimonas sp. TaxID=2892404 RepID=UPI003F8191A5
MRQYPQLEFDLALLRSNADAVISRCRGMGIRVCGVIKGVDGMPEAARVLRAAGAAELGTSRLEQVAKCRAAGVPGPWLLIRIPGLTELPDVVALCETSLQSEWPTLLALEEECLRQNKTHRVIVMTDLGDLREGFWDKKELVDVCERVERELPHVHLAGIGVNLTCYGSTKPTPEKMNELVGLARQVEQRIGRKLEIVSGGATSSFTLVHWGTMPAGVNHLRIGEAILLGKDLQVDWGIRDMDYLRMDALTLRAEVVEVKDKPTYPIGEFAIDAFGRKPVYEDRGIRRRAILALGRADVGELESLIPREPGLTVIGGSSDHCIVDVEDCPRRLQVGDIVEFSLCYSHMLYATARSDMRIIFKNQSAQEE